jgi:tRNA threonylcarbamoyladenosine biosynthesis protein TsaB
LPVQSIVGFDTATDDTAVAALRGEEVVHESSVQRTENGRPAHATRLLGEVEAAVDALGGWESVERIGVGVGPGSFTGLRIGIATAQALAKAEGLELVGVGSLDALARGAFAHGGEQDVLAAIDARRNELFSALFAPGGERLSEPAVEVQEELVSRFSQLPSATLAVGSGALRFRDELRKAGIEVPADDDPVHRISAAQTCAIGAGLDASGEPAVEPLYLRRPDAERWRERDGKDI